MLFRVPITLEAATSAEAASFASALQAMLSEAGFQLQVGSATEVEPDPSVVEVFTDGGFDRTLNGIGAWAYLVRNQNGEQFHASGAMISTTNNRMEMMAVKKALENLEVGQKIRIYSDSEYVVKGLTLWSRNWVRNGWRTKDGDPVKNRDLWKPLLDLFQIHDARIVHVKGHAGNEGNEFVDALCTQQMQASWAGLCKGEDTVEVDQRAESAAA